MKALILYFLALLPWSFAWGLWLDWSMLDWEYYAVIGLSSYFAMISHFYLVLRE